MEQNYIGSGLNLNPILYWKYVMAIKRSYPCIVFFDIVPKQLETWAKKYPRISFIVEFSNYREFPNKYFSSNIIYRWRESLSDEEWLERWRWTDILLCDKEKLDYWLQANLCGVKCIFNEKDLNLDEVQVLTSVERIENWENAKNLLT